MYYTPLGVIVFSKLRSSLHTSQVARHQAGAYPGFCSMKRLGVFLTPLDGMLVHRRLTPALNSSVLIYYSGPEPGPLAPETSAG